jgi:hypothetical protein
VYRTDNCGVGGAKSGNIDGVAGAVQTKRYVFQYRDYTFNATDVEMQPVRITRQYDMTKPIIPAADIH